MEGRSKETGIADKVLKSMRRKVKEKGLKLSITEVGQEGKSNVIASFSYLEDNFQEYSRREGVGLATSVETSGVDFRTRTKQLGAEQKARR